MWKLDEIDDSGCELLICCPKCGHCGRMDAAAITAALNKKAVEPVLAEALPRLRCKACRAKGIVLIRSAWTNARRHPDADDPDDKYAATQAVAAFFQLTRKLGKWG